MARKCNKKKTESPKVPLVPEKEQQLRENSKIEVTRKRWKSGPCSCVRVSSFLRKQN